MVLQKHLVGLLYMNSMDSANYIPFSTNPCLLCDCLVTKKPSLSRKDVNTIYVIEPLLLIRHGIQS
jgi:hypothetical protein